MTQKTAIRTGGAPSSQLYSQALIAGGFIFVSGQVAIDPATGKLVSGGLKEQFNRVFDNIEAILREAKATCSHLIRVEIYLKDIADFAEMNKLYLERVNVEPKPVRHAMQVAALPLDAKIEVTVIAVAPKIIKK
jgi:2-iminobutanoate/2-iminopropanoate deaminase